ncbi:phosphoenolpyruvate-protein phosphotransferase [mine drainage metagenome]|uniref:Phosphoenolpyruvate-protein phosphotransferase n=1 Tax=mine drainage metagenome TaxID=410659 RepID=A0A1J5TQU4_9ZZZZ
MQGIAASKGIAYGQVFVYLQSNVEVPSYAIDTSRKEEEIRRFEKALVVTRQQIQKIQDEVARNLGKNEAAIFDAHLLVLEDQALLSETIRAFEETGKNIETCFHSVASRYIEAFAAIDDEYLRERAADLRDVTQRVLQNLLGQSTSSLSQLVDKRIVVANDINPSDSASIDRSQALAIVTDTGSKTSHAVIVARSMKIPAVVGVTGLTGRVKEGDWAIVDGYDGVIIVNPTEQTLFRYGQIRMQKNGFEQRLIEANTQPAITLDGVAVSLMANIEKTEEAPIVKEYRAEGVGLFRTEYLYLSSARMPSEQEQFIAYKSVIDAVAPEPVVIRTLDLGGDKQFSGKTDLFPEEDNPFMGFRAIRFCLENVPIFKEQLRAILLASAFGKVRLMFPMISGGEELARAIVLLEECKRELTERGQTFDPELEVGSMIEIPSAAMTADIIARQCDFFSIGTNDLIQYMIAIDRVNNRIAHLYEPTHPAVVRMLKRIVDEGHRAKIPVAVCGEMAGDPVFVPLLLGLGVDELSMTPPLIPAVKYLVRSMTMQDAKALAEKALEMDSAKEIFALCDEFYRTRVNIA